MVSLVWLPCFGVVEALLSLRVASLPCLFCQTLSVYEVGA